MKKKTKKKNEKQIKRIMRISYVFLILAGIALILAAGYMGYYEFFVHNLYRSFKFNFISGIFGYSGMLLLLLYFLYLLTVITFINPQILKWKKRVPFTVAGAVVLCLTIWFLKFSVTEINLEAKDMKSYANGEWNVKELEVKHVDRTPGFSMATIDTSEGEFLLYRRIYATKPGEIYRITYLEETKTVIDIDLISDGE
ncbi:hypothetical protein [Ornithinibacillus scapharcae]|uniref:hypothetical protein n=1 Tax=Ornithinibacillus scapharcae TaxID=1147159 RepID=UPI000225B7BE|nr:hypothetical protein [Ornithinibacillus scapharcae]